VDFQESPEITLLRESVAKITAKYGHDYYVAKARNDERATELWDELGKNGFLGVNIPEEYGGGGMGLSELAAVGEEIAAQGCPLLLLIVSPAICANVIAQYGTEEQKQRWLPGIASGQTKMAFAITEPDAGTNTHQISTTATPHGDGYRINGAKYYISGVDESDAILVVARTSYNEAKGQGRMSLFVVPTDAPGLERTVIPVQVVAPDKQYTLFFDDVEVGADALVGELDAGFKSVFAGLNPERVMIAAMGNGIARYALEKAAAYAIDRRVWGVPIGAHQGLAHPLAQAKIEADLARLMTQKAAWLYDQGLDAGESANMAKYAAAEAALACLDTAIQVHGGNGLSDEYGLADLWFAARLLRTAPVSREMVLNFVAEHSLGLPKSY
jgi:alkylation response protein AidB-like acyl-CoA dehydrogenase